MYHMSEMQHIANPEPLPGPSPHILYGHLCWFQAREVHYMMAFKMAITVIPDGAKSRVRAHSLCIKCYTQLLGSVPTKQRIGRLPKNPQLQLLFAMRSKYLSKDPSISGLLK